MTHSPAGPRDTEGSCAKAGQTTSCRRRAKGVAPTTCTTCPAPRRTAPRRTKPRRTKPNRTGRYHKKRVRRVVCGRNGYKSAWNVRTMPRAQQQRTHADSADSTRARAPGTAEPASWSPRHQTPDTRRHLRVGLPCVDAAVAHHLRRPPVPPSAVLVPEHGRAPRRDVAAAVGALVAGVRVRSRQQVQLPTPGALPCRLALAHAVAGAALAVVGAIARGGTGPEEARRVHLGSGEGHPCRVDVAVALVQETGVGGGTEPAG